MRRLLIEKKGGTTEIALLSDRVLTDYSVYKDGAIEAEQVYLGLVERIAKGMNAAFVRLSENENGFLPLSETKVPVKGGDTLVVQVKKPPVQEKSAYVTADIALAGTNVILLPYGKRVMASSRAADESAHAALLALGQSLCPKGMGLVMRRNALDVSRETLEREIEALCARWQAILQKKEHAHAPCLLDGGLSPALRALRDHAPDTVTVNDEALLSLCPGALFASEPFSLYDVRGQLKKARARHVWLKSGGFLVIDPCEALTVIDVNTGKFTGGKSGAESTFLSLNLEAVKEIARLMRLNSMGGIILVDFIDMCEDAHKQAVLDAMREALLSDPVKCVVHGFTSLGLMEITRKKAAPPLSAVKETPCPHCGGTGVIQEDV